MKKVSAFSVFKGKKEKVDTPTLERNSSKRGSLKKASSEPTINGDEDSRSKKLLRAIKGGSFRNTVRGNKHRPANLGDGTGNSPFVAGDGAEVKLTSVKGKSKTEVSAVSSVNVTPALPKKSKKIVTPKSGESTKAGKQKKNLPPLPIPDFTETPKSSTHLTNGEAASAGKIKGKRGLDDTSPSSSLSKKKRVESPKQAPVQTVNPQRKDKLNKKKLMPNAVLDSVYDSTEEAKNLFECMIHPVQTDKFFKELWQKKPLLVRRHIRNYNDGWFSTEELDKILEKEHIEFGVNLDVTSYRDGKRETHNPPGRAYRSVVWDYYQNGCSVRMLNPQTYSKNVWKMLSTLQEYFGCCVGANVYLTPPGTQGFAPHYDDIEAFILQLEGKKHWKLYNPRSEQETLPRESSGNFDQLEIGSPILDVTLEAGDLLYFPRGTIHQGYALEDAHSMHITFSCYQRNTWGDLFQKLIPRALEIAIEEDVEFREGLPIDYLHYTGVVNSDIESSERKAFTQKISSLLTKLIQNYCPIDAACDQLGKQFIHDSLPPVFSEMEKSCSVHGHGERWDPVSQAVKGNTEVEPDTMIKLVRKGCLRLLTEDDTVRVYHNIENARVYHGREPQSIEITADLAPAVEFLIHSYPEYVSVDSLPAASVEERVEISSILYDKGLLITGGKPEVVIDVDEMNGDMLVDQGDDSEENEDVIESDQSTPTLEDGLEKTSLPDGESNNSMSDSNMSSQEDSGQMGKLYNQGDNYSYRSAQKNRRFPVPVELISNAETLGSDMIPSGRLNDVLGKHIQDMLPVNEDIEKLPSEQIPNSLPTEYIDDVKDVAPIGQGTSRTQEEQFEMFTAEQQRKSLEPAERVAKLEPVENNANFLSSEQIQEMILAEQKKDLLIANKLQESLTEEYRRLIIPPKQNQKTSTIRQNRDMFQDETIQDIPDNKVEEKEEVLKNSSDLDKELDCKKEKIELEFMEEKILVEKVSEQEGSSSPADDYPYSCGLCHFKTRYEQSLNRHISLKHENLPLLKCEYCDYGSKDKYSLKRHYRLIHLEDLDQSNPKLPTCNMCGEPSVDEDELIYHKKTAHDFTVVDYKCSDCSFVSQRHDCLNKHQRTIHRNMEFTCCWKCTQSFYRKIDFKEHVCPAETACVKCHICSKMLSSPKCLQAHNQLHYGHHKHRCEICNDSFLKRFQLLRHINIKHEDNTMRYSCGECSSSFLYKASLARHVKAAHAIKQEDNTMRYSCGECTSSFLYKANLARHVKAAHADQKESHIDGKYQKKQLSAKKKILQTENQLKNYVCPKCTSYFVFKGSLIRHIQKKHPQTVSTDDTEESSQLKV